MATSNGYNGDARRKTILENYRRLPSVDALVAAVETELPHEEVVALARIVLEEARQAVRTGAQAPELATLAARLSQRCASSVLPTLRPVINATGVVLHTNLGRAPLSAAALEAMRTVAGGYSNLEYDLERGERGGRYAHVGTLLARLTGAEAALVVNNNAAAVLLVLSCLCAGREVLVSRGQAVEIGGGFRIPDVLAQSGARLVEVGTTNRTYAEDYLRTITAATAAILTVHRSNFRLMGFTHDPADAELAAAAHSNGIVWIDDWGSGSLLQPGDYGLLREPTMSERVAAGCDLVCSSGDKLLGGPQAGLILGKRSLIEQLRKHPLLRALRVDKLTLAALHATLLSYLQGRATEEIPVWRMIGAGAESLHARATALVNALAQHGVRAEVASCMSTIGGGSLPGETLPSVAVALAPDDADGLARQLRGGDPPVVGRIADGRLLLDLRTVLEEQSEALVGAVMRAVIPGEIGLGG